MPPQDALGSLCSPAQPSPLRVVTVRGQPCSFTRLGACPGHHSLQPGRRGLAQRRLGGCARPNDRPCKASSPRLRFLLTFGPGFPRGPRRQGGEAAGRKRTDRHPPWRCSRRVGSLELRAATQGPPKGPRRGCPGTSWLPGDSARRPPASAAVSVVGKTPRQTPGCGQEMAL